MSSVFRTEEMSVHLSDHTSKAKVTNNAAGCDLAEFTVGDVRAEGCIVARDPSDPSHGLIYNQNDPGVKKISSGMARRIRDRAKHLTPPNY